VAPFVLEGDVGSRKLKIAYLAVIRSGLSALLILLERQLFLVQEIILLDLETVFKTAAIVETLAHSIPESGLASVLFKGNPIPRIFTNCGCLMSE
jgi:hypothetical protein